jgi:membrane protein
MADEALCSRAGPSVVWPILCSAALIAAYTRPKLSAYIELSGGSRSRKVLSGSSQAPQAVQHGRALQPGPGPPCGLWQIPLEGWKDIVWRTYERIVEDRLLAVAAGVVLRPACARSRGYGYDLALWSLC